MQHGGAAAQVPAEYIYFCRQLLLEHEKAWLEYQQGLAKGTEPVQQPSTSQLISIGNQTYDCSQNRGCNGNCLWEGTEAHQKCKCLQLYAPGYSHLIAPCKDKSQGPELSFDQCKKLGYLNSGVTLPSPNYPAITCDHCKEAFQILQHNFTPYNYSQVQACIDRLANPPATTKSSQLSKAQYGWIGALLVCILVLIGFIAYKVYKGCAHKDAGYCLTPIDQKKISNDQDSTPP
jgi:hypothetical protein